MGCPMTLAERKFREFMAKNAEVDRNAQVADLVQRGVFVYIPDMVVAVVIPALLLTEGSSSSWPLERVTGACNGEAESDQVFLKSMAKASATRPGRCWKASNSD